MWLHNPLIKKLNTTFLLQTLFFEGRYCLRYWLHLTQNNWGLWLLLFILSYTVGLYIPTGQKMLYTIALWVCGGSVSAIVFTWQQRYSAHSSVSLLLIGLGILCGTGLAGTQWQTLTAKQLSPHWNNQWVTATGTLWPDEQGWQLKTDRINRHPITAQLGLGKKLTFSPDMIGSQLTIGGVLKRPLSPRFVGDFDDWHYRLAKHQEGSLLRATVLNNLGKKQLHWWELVQASILTPVHCIRERVATIFQQTLGVESGSLLGGVVLGDRAIQLPPHTKEAFQKTGQIHLVAASGMNIAFVAGCMSLLLAFLPQKPFRLLKFLLISIGVGFYALLTGLPPSIKRAATMWQLGIWVKGLQQRIYALNLLLLAVGLLCWIDGTCVFSVGFQLSVLTTLGIIVYTPTLERWGQRLHLPNWLNLAIMVTTVAQLWANPLILYYFHQIPLHATVFNAISSVVVAPITMLGFMGTLGLGIHHSITQACASFASWGLKLMLATAYWGAGFTQAIFTIPKPIPINSVLMGYCVLLLPVFYRLLQLQWQRPSLRSSQHWQPWLLSSGAITVGLLLGFFQQSPQVSTVLATASTPYNKQERILYFLPLSANKSVYLLESSPPKKDVLAILPATFSSRDAHTVSNFLFQKQLNFPKQAIILNTPPRTKQRSKRANNPKFLPLTGLRDAQQQWGLNTLYTADTTDLKPTFTKSIKSMSLGHISTVPTVLPNWRWTPQWCSHSKRERWQVCLLATVGSQRIWFGNKASTQRVAWQQPKHHQYQAIRIESNTLMVIE
jgi:ComEC/Rec2-related protein